MASDNFYSRIKNIEARMNKLKTLGLSSSSSLSVDGTTFSVYLQIVPTRVDTITGEVLDCASSRFCSVKIKTKNNENALFGLRLISPTNFTEYLYVEKIGANNSTYKYGFDIDTGGSQVERDILTNGGTLPVVEYRFKVVSTSEITLDIAYRNRDI